MAHHANTAHQVRTPRRSRVHEIPASRNVDLDALPLFAITGGVVVEIGIVHQTFEIQGQMGVDPETDTQTTREIGVDLAITIRNRGADPRDDVPAAVAGVRGGHGRALHAGVLGVRHAYGTG